MKHPYIEYIRVENLHFWPGEGLSVDGYCYWLRKGDKFDSPDAMVKRISRETWIEWGKRRHSPPEQKGNFPSMKLELFADDGKHRLKVSQVPEATMHTMTEKT
jgi:hypothetical protein